jgi:hypothetical protein
VPANLPPRYPAQTHKFLVVLGSVSLGFSKVSGLSGDAAPEYMYEGGRETPYPLTQACHRPQTLVFEHGMGALNLLEQAPLGKFLKIPGQWEHCPVAGTIIIQRSRRRIGFDSIMPIRWEIGDLDASGGDVLIHRLEIVHNGLYYV